jgi:general stress protein YciG
MHRRKRSLTEEERKLWQDNPTEFFRQMGARGGRKRNRVVTKEEIRKWGRKGGKARQPR